MNRRRGLAWFSAVLISVLLFRVTTGQKVNIEAVRLQGGNQTAGRVEVRVNGVWGTVCDDNWDNQDAIVTCRQLQFSGGVALKRAVYGQGTGTIFMDDVFCSGDENSLGECQFTSTSNCDHSEDASVICQPVGAASLPPATTTTPKPGVTQPSNCQGGSNAQANVRLYGIVQGVGYVQVRSPNGQFGYVCDDFWDTNAAKIVCNELCYNITMSEPGMKKELIPIVDSATIVLDDVKCVGTESTLSDCSHRPWFQHDCAATELAAVSCVQASYPTPPPPKPGLQCRKGDLIAVFNKTRDPNLEPKHLSVENPGPNCNFRVDNTDPKVMTAKISFEDCNTNVSQNESHIIYSNAILMKPTTQEGAISRSNTFLIKLTCEMPRNDSVDQEVEPLTQVVTQRTEGKFVITMTIFEDQLFSKPTPSYPFQLDLGEWVNAAVELESIDSRLKLVVTDCTAKADKTSGSPTKALIVNKCPSDSSTMEIYPLSQVKMGLRFQSFVFVNYPTMFVECDTIVCLTSEVTAECDRSCNSSKPAPTASSRRRRDIPEAETGRYRRAVQVAETGDSQHRAVYKVTSEPIAVTVHPLSSSTAATSNTTLKRTTTTPATTTTTPTPSTTTPTPTTTTTTERTSTTQKTTPADQSTRSSSQSTSGTTQGPVTVITVRATGATGSTVTPAGTTTQPSTARSTQRPAGSSTWRPQSDASLQSPDTSVRSAATWHGAWLLTVITTVTTAFLCVCPPF